MELNAIREITLQVLRDLFIRFRNAKNDAQFLQDLSTGNIASKVAWRAYQAGLWKPSERPHRDEELYIGDLFPSEDVSTVRSVLWHFVGLGILTPRSMLDDRNQFFEVSTYGRNVLEDTKESPYDPLNFMKRLATDSPNLEHNTVDYVKEAVDCFLGRYLRAATVMIGLASESEVLSLIEAYGNTLECEKKVSFEKKISSCRNFKSKFDELYSYLSQDIKSLPLEIRELDTWLQGIFQIIRLYRNDAGHPIGKNPTSDEVHANLTLFRTYARFLSKLKEYLSNKAIYGSSHEPK